MMYNFLLFQKRGGEGCVIFPNFQPLFPPLDLRFCSHFLFAQVEIGQTLIS